MSIGMGTQCILCHLGKNIDIARSLGDEATACAFAMELMKKYVEAPDYASAPYFSGDVEELFKRFYHLEGDRFAQEKAESNAFALSRMERVREAIESSTDPLYAALQFAVLGNYIDYSALRGEMSFDTLDTMLGTAAELKLPKDSFEQMKKDLAAAKSLLILTDNAGEIVFDKLLAQQLQKAYPQITIRFCVKGGAVLNDATRADAAEIDLGFPLLDSGIAASGFVPERVGEEAKLAFGTADVVLAKGQANTETLLGCGKNVYYAFLVKCQRFIDLFQKPKFTPMLVRELST